MSRENIQIQAKVPPHSKDAERSILGYLLQNLRGFDDICDYIYDKEVFYAPAHQVIFECIMSLYQQDKKPDIITLTEEVIRRGKLEEIGGAYTITQLVDAYDPRASLQQWVGIVYECYLRRKIIELSISSASESYDASNDTFDILDGLEAKLTQLSNKNAGAVYKTDFQAANEVYDNIIAARNSATELIGIDTGYKNMNDLTGGLKAPNLVIIAGRPGAGKTAFALNLCNNANKSGKRVAFFSLEMDKKELMERKLSMNTGVFYDKIRKPKQLTDYDLKKIEKELGMLGTQDPMLFIDDSSTLNLFQFRSRARRMKRKHNIDMIVVDYLQLMTGERSKGSSNREQEIASISRTLKQIAKELEIPVIALSQMSRDVEKRKGEPILSDLRESGAIEQDADIVMFIWREDYGLSKEETDPALIGKTSVKIAKHRGGSLDTLQFNAKLEIQKFYDAENDFLSQSEYNSNDATLYIESGAEKPF